ncbi:hypothetical protein [Methanobrevibacter filiformis]|uniref:Uncharacterized protein n=1 Tax=Methanobrevibacter filiformis TaxID=55758 RepID=A0A165Z4B6_9EURY|nr:hypothetical protein [Methanobrevibacter filiformis]KZX10231.1 hypothetical protein MBFIL_18420 [Methanobrevibacter filiformis]
MHSQSVEKKLNSIASAIVSTMRVLGQALNLGIITLVFTIILGSVEISMNIKQGLIESFFLIAIISLILCILAILLQFMVIKIKRINMLE